MTRQQPINFLPASYRHRVRQSWRNRRQAGLALVLVMALGAWWFVQQHQTAQLEQRAAELNAEVDSARQRMTELMELREQYQRLRHQVRVQQLLSEPVRRTQIMATLGTRMPEPVTLVRLVLDTERPSAASVVGRGESTGAHPHRVHLELAALAPDDMTVANLLTALKEHVLFDEVAMHHSRPVEQFDVIARQFRLTTVVDLDRQFEPIDGAGQPLSEPVPSTEATGADARAAGEEPNKEMARVDP